MYDIIFLYFNIYYNSAPRNILKNFAFPFKVKVQGHQLHPGTELDEEL